jgi:hypothetical protein
MRSRGLALTGLALAAVIAAPAGTLAAVPRESVTTVPDPTVHVTPDRIAEIPFYLQACTDAKTCGAPITLYARGGRLLTDAAPAAFLPSLGPGSFPGLRLTRAASQDLKRTHRPVHPPQVETSQRRRRAARVRDTATTIDRRGAVVLRHSPPCAAMQRPVPMIAQARVVVPS